MKRIRKNGNFLLALLVNMLLTLEWTIPAWILLVCHYLFGWSIWWFWLTLGAWLLMILFWMDLIGWAARCGSTSDRALENKNPYSKNYMNIKER